MKTTVFELRSGGVVTDVREEPDWQPFEEYDGKPLERVRVQDLIEPPGALIQLVEIAAGGSFAMHSSPDVAFCQIVRGRGRLGLPDGRELEYRAPELYVFLPGTLHDWHAVEENTLLSVCLVRQSS
jgi:quercetin dioxygenase-like cupin family protein